MWGGQFIDAHGETLDLASMSGLKDASLPTTANELCQYVQATTWISNYIPRFAEHIDPLRQVLEQGYKYKKSHEEGNIQGAVCRPGVVGRTP